MFGVGIAEAPVHGKIPDGTVNGVNGCAEDEERLETGRLVDPVQAERHVKEYCERIFTAID